MSVYRIIEKDDLGSFKESEHENKNLLEYIFYAVKNKAYKIVE